MELFAQLTSWARVHRPEGLEEALPTGGQRFTNIG
jgi:hypothetical protein